jgi:hypothetical protein
VTGRFQSMDSDGFAAEDPNLYRYVFNETTNTTDPTGNFPLIAAPIVVGVIATVSTFVGVTVYQLTHYMYGTGPPPTLRDNAKAALMTGVGAAIITVAAATAPFVLGAAAIDLAVATIVTGSVGVIWASVEYGLYIIPKMFAEEPITFSTASATGLKKMGADLIDQGKAQIAQQNAQQTQQQSGYVWKTEFFATMDSIMQSIGAPALSS